MKYEIKTYVVGVNYHYNTPATLTLEAENAPDAMIKASELLKELNDDIIEMECKRV